MYVDGKAYRTIWVDDLDRLTVINQQLLPHSFQLLHLESLNRVAWAIKDMVVRGAGLIGASAAYGMWVAANQYKELNGQKFWESLENAARLLKQTRPTAGNLAWAVDRVMAALDPHKTPAENVAAARKESKSIADADADFCRRIGQHGLAILQDLSSKKSGAVINVLTHCNAGWLAFVDYGSALAPVYAAHAAGIPIHVWVDETRPRNQGASLTAWELAHHGVPHSLIADNAGGHLMQHGFVDLLITGADRVTRCGDAANKIGTYLKALAAMDNQVPFYVALPSSTLDFSMRDGRAEIPIEERGGEELSLVSGILADGRLAQVRICPEQTVTRNWGFDVTPARLVSGLITERGICPASEAGIMGLFPEQAAKHAG